MLKTIKDVIMKHWLTALSVIAIFAVCLSFCFSKKGMFLDEIYSYGLSNSQDAPFITSIDGNIVDTTITNDTLFDYVAVTGEDAFDYSSVYYNQSKDVHPPLFYMLLHTVSSVFQNSFSKWIGLGLNLVLFAGTLALLYLTVNKLFKSRTVARCGVILYGLSTLAISTMLMIRMYMLLSLLTVLLMYAMVHLHESRKWYNYLFVALTVLAGLLTQYYYVFYAFFVCAAYCISLWAKKDFKHSGIFAASAVAGVLCAYLIFPYCIDHLLGSTAVAGSSALSNLTDFANYGTRLKTFVGFVTDNSKVVFFVGMGAMFLCAFNIKGLWQEYKAKNFDLQALVYIIPGGIAFVIVAIISPYVAARYIYNLVPVIIVAVCFFISLAEKSFKKGAVNGKAFTAVLLVVAVWAAFSVDPSFVYRHYEAQEKQISQYSEQPCVYITENRNPAITQDLEQLLNFESIHITLSTDSEELENYINSFDSYSNIVVHIASYPTALGDEKLLNELCDKYGFDTYERLYKRQFSSVYVLKNE